MKVRLLSFIVRTLEVGHSSLVSDKKWHCRQVNSGAAAAADLSLRKAGFGPLRIGMD
jgi:hypothetical protein